MDHSLIEEVKMAFSDFDVSLTKQRTAHLEQQNKQLSEILEKMNNEGKKISQKLDKIYSQVNEVIKKNNDLAAENQRLRNATQ
jgi:cytochrome c556